LKISKDRIGTYSLQVIIENIVTEEEKAIVFNSLKDKIFEMSLVKILIILTF
jgi:hypothetical protein